MLFCPYGTDASSAVTSSVYVVCASRGLTVTLGVPSRVVGELGPGAGRAVEPEHRVAVGLAARGQRRPIAPTA